MLPEPARESSESGLDLRNKPQRRSRRRPAFFLVLLLAVAFLIGGGTLLVSQLGHGEPMPPQKTIVLQTPTPTPLPQPTIVAIECAHYPASYDDALRQELAQGLGLTVAQVTTRIRAGQTIREVAAAEQVAPERLYDLELYAYKVSDIQMVKGGCMSLETEQQHHAESASQLNQDFTRLFAAAPARVSLLARRGAEASDEAKEAVQT